MDKRVLVSTGWKNAVSALNAGGNLHFKMPKESFILAYNSHAIIQVLWKEDSYLHIYI